LQWAAADQEEAVFLFVCEFLIEEKRKYTELQFLFYENSTKISVIFWMR